MRGVGAAVAFAMVWPAAAGCIAVRGLRITGADLARAGVGGGSIPPDEFIAFAPLPGASRRLGVRDLTRLAGRYGVLNTPPGEVCFIYEAGPLDVVAAGRAIRTALAAEQVEVIDYTRFPVPFGEAEWSGAAARRPDGTLLVRGAIRYDGRRTVPVWARVKAWWRERRIVARARIEPGSQIGPGDVEELEALVEDRGGNWVRELEAVIGRILRRRVDTGQPIAAAWLDRPWEVERGQRVLVEAKSAGARLALTARAESSGRRRDRVVLLNEESGRRFAARVTGPGRAEAGEGEPGKGAAR